MKKTLIAFIAGQALQLIILVVAVHLTYATNIVLFCCIGGGMATAVLGAGIFLDRIELAVQENDMEEAAPLPAEIKVTNDKVEKEPPKKEEGKHIKIVAEKPSSLMEKALAEVGNG